MMFCIAFVQFKPFLLNAPFLYPLKTSENLTVYGFPMFPGVREKEHWERVG